MVLILKPAKTYSKKGHRAVTIDNTIIINIQLSEASHKDTSDSRKKSILERQKNVSCTKEQKSLKNKSDKEIKLVSKMQYVNVVNSRHTLSTLTSPFLTSRIKQGILLQNRLHNYRCKILNNSLNPVKLIINLLHLKLSLQPRSILLHKLKLISHKLKLGAKSLITEWTTS